MSSAAQSIQLTELSSQRDMSTLLAQSAVQVGLHGYVVCQAHLAVVHDSSATACLCCDYSHSNLLAQVQSSKLFAHTVGWGSGNPPGSSCIYMLSATTSARPASTNYRAGGKHAHAVRQGFVELQNLE